MISYLTRFCCLDGAGSGDQGVASAAEACSCAHAGVQVRAFRAGGVCDALPHQVKPLHHSRVNRYAAARIACRPAHGGVVSSEELGRVVCRRAQENSDMMGGVGHEMRLLRGDCRSIPVPYADFTALCPALVLQPRLPSRLYPYSVQAPCLQSAWQGQGCVCPGGGQRVSHV